MTAQITPRLVIAGVDRAIAFYRETLGARVVERFADDQGCVVHAALDIDGAVIALTEDQPQHGNTAPTSLGGTAVILNIVVDDVDAVGARFEQGGAKVVFPISDQFYGHREGRFRDPFGHLWIITTIVEVLTPEQIQARMAGGIG